MNKPFLYFAFVPDPDQSQEYLEYVVQEEKGIRYKLVNLKANELLDYEAYSRDVNADYILDTLPPFHQQIRVFHFSGHARSVDLAFRNSQYTVDNLARMLGDMSTLHLVVLNGCSTHGFVKRLHEAGVPAVLATTERIGDKSACDFALAFYQTLTIPQMSLRSAFEKATTVLGDQSGEVLVRGELGPPADGEVLPWGLYLKEGLSKVERETVLNWRLIEGEDQPVIIPESSKKLLSAFEEMQQAFFRERPHKIEEIKRYERLLGRLGSSPQDVEDADFFKQKIAEVKEWIGSKEKALDAKYGEITQHALQNKRRSDREMIRQHLERINFSYQIDDFQDALIEHDADAHAFIVRGSPVCGHEILLQRLLEIAEIDHENTFTRIEVSFSSQSHTTPSSTNIWSKLQIALNGLSSRYVESNEPAKILEAILARYYAPNHIVFVFKDVYPNVQLNISVIKEFWETFLDHFQRARQNRRPPGTSRFRVLLFVLDKNCLVNQLIHCRHDADYQQQLQQELPEGRQAFLLRNIALVNLKELKEWRKKGVPLSLLQKLGKLETFIGDPGMPVLTTIHRICDKVHAEDVFNDLLSAHHIQYIPLDALHQQLSESL